MTRHPRMGAVEELLVPLREPQWNERPTANDRENTGVYRLLSVNLLKAGVCLVKIASGSQGA